MVNSEILTPLSDALMISPWNIRYTTFRFGPIIVHFVLKDIEKLPPDLSHAIHSIHDHRTGELMKFKKYVIFCIVNEFQAYIMSQYDSREEAWIVFKDIIQKLKYGEAMNITDEAGLYEELELSYRGIKWIHE